MSNNLTTLDHRNLTTAEAICLTLRKQKRKPKKSLKKSKEKAKLAQLSNNNKQLNNVINSLPPTDSQMPHIIIQSGAGPENVNNIIKLKDKLTDKELRFINYYMTGEYNRIEAMNLAGYGDMNDRYKQYLAAQIVQRHESQTEDHRIICRALGAGEVAVIRGLLDLARNAHGEMVRLNAWSQLSKILGLTKDQLEGAGGVTIVFEGAQTQAQAQPGAPPLLPSQGEITVLPATSRKPMMITK